MKNPTINVLLATAVMFATVPASAQSGDVVVMRRVVSKPAERVAWSTGPWTKNSTCGAAIPATRTVQCVRKTVGQPDAVLQDSACAGPKPAAAETQADESGCSYQWDVQVSSSWSTMCGRDSTRSLTVTCKRSDGTVLPDARCSGTKPLATEKKDVFDGCGYAWGVDQQGPWSSTCSSDAIRSRAVFCSRSDGERVGAEKCDAGTRPGETEHAAITSSCTAYWEEGPWGAWSSTCGAGTRTRTVSCRQKDPATGVPIAGTVPAARCQGLPKPATSESGNSVAGCAYQWRQGSEYFDQGKSVCTGGTLSTTVLYDCYRVQNGVVEGDRVEASNCQTYDPRNVVSAYRAEGSKSYSCVIDNVNAQTIPATDLNDTPAGRGAITRMMPGMLSETAALAQGRQLCRSVNPYWSKSYTSCVVTFQTNPAANTTWIAVGAESYGMTDMVDLRATGSGWSRSKSWAIRFSSTGSGPAYSAGVIVNAKPDPTSKAGPNNCGQSVAVQQFGDMGTVFDCTGQ